MKTENYHANTVRYLDKLKNKSLIQMKDEYDEHGLLKKVIFNYIGVGSSSGKSAEYIYDFETLKINDSEFIKTKKIESKEELKNHLLKKFNKNPDFTLICPKENCDDPNCKPHLSIGNKITNTENTKRPYFASNCNGINYGESALHLNSKIDIHQYLVEKKASYLKDNKKTLIENIEIEKTFSFGNGQERRADIYYEKHYTKSNGELVIEKFAIEVQRSNILYEELKERTEWYKEQEIATFWIVLDDIFLNNKEMVKILSTTNLNLPLLSLISFSMKHYNGRFFTYDAEKRKILTLTLQQENIENFNQLENSEKTQIKKLYTTDNLYIISNEKENEYYKLLPYVNHRQTSNIYSDILSFGIFKDNKDIMHCNWNSNKKTFEYAKFLKLSVTSTQKISKPKFNIIKQKKLLNTKPLLTRRQIVKL